MEIEFTKGGRNKQAPYTTTHVRIPEKIKDYVIELSNQYKISIQEEKEQQFLKSLDKPVNKKILIELAEKVVKLKQQKKSTKEALENLLTYIINN